MKHQHLILFLACSFGCGPIVTEPKPDIPETVEYDTVRIEYEDPNALSVSHDVIAQALIGDPSWTALLTRSVVDTTNLIMLAPFVLLEEIKKAPPTAFNETTWIWEFENEDGAFRMEIFDLGESLLVGSRDYSFRIFGGDNTDELLEVISGSYTLTEGRFLASQRGYGVLHFNFDNQRAIDGKEDDVYGQMYIAFRVLGGVKQVVVLTDDVRKPSEPPSALTTNIYRYVTFRDRIGQFSFASKTDFLNDGEPLETMSVHSTWLENEGRSRSSVVDGSLTINELLLDECWEDDVITYAAVTPDIPNLNYSDGEPENCNSILRNVQLSPPQLEATPDRLTDPPDPHPDEADDVIVER